MRSICIDFSKSLRSFDDFYLNKMESNILVLNQCEKIWRNFATLVNFYSVWQNYLRLLWALGKTVGRPTAVEFL